MGFTSIVYRSRPFCQWRHHWRKCQTLPNMYLSWYKSSGGGDPSMKTPFHDKILMGPVKQGSYKDNCSCVSLSVTALSCQKVSISHSSTLYQFLTFIPTLFFNGSWFLMALEEVIYIPLYHWSITLIFFSVFYQLYIYAFTTAHCKN